MEIWFLLRIVGCIIMILIAGCTSQAPTTAITTAPTPLPVVTTAATITTEPPVQTPIPVATTQAATVIVISTTAFPTTDPILHRWVRQYTDTTTGHLLGYEFKFYPDGTLNYREGTPKMVSDNIRIDIVTGSASGTWSSLGDNKYLVKIQPSGQNGAQFIREYTRVPAHEDKAYPGVVIAEHIESSYEKDSINPVRLKPADEMYYPERAKLD